METATKIYVAGHRGMVGAAVVRRLERAGYHNLVVRTSQELDLRNQAAVAAFFAQEQPEVVVLAAAKVGGIVANNTYRADFLYDNLLIQNNVIGQSHEHDVQKLLFLGSSCIYPKMAPQPIKEEYLLTGRSNPPTNPTPLPKSRA
jgi:GDP-L-fucose synthase